MVHEILGIRFWRDDPLGQPILGTIPNINRLDRDTLLGFKSNYYTPDETLVCAAGKLEHEAFVELVQTHMGTFPHTKAGVSKVQRKSDSSAHVEQRDLEQVHVCIGMEGPSAVDPRRHAGYILTRFLVAA